ncbi:hypothetical protein IFJ82_03045 [Novacetimonas hansenii]|uniref:phage neck terminator protein n=1 Tax=Novacetimonas hansenii TaxID=436 RepID=UPI000A8C094F|nr:hypothetical protein [Novacetimonas hansenii]QOF95658.1 hypothetical protein IFJ82_03045 [Novacetimonas hansenii]
MVEADGAQAAAGDVTEGTVLTALGQWLCATIPLPADAVMVGQVNRVAPPCGAFAIMTVAGRGRIATNRTTYGAGCRIVWMQQQVDVRVDLHGAGAGDGAGRIALLFRDPACAAFLAGYGTIAPLYAAPPRQRDFVSDAAQYEDVWQVTVSLQVNSTVTFAQDFANALNVGIFETDATFPPE